MSYQFSEHGATKNKKNHPKQHTKTTQVQFSLRRNNCTKVQVYGLNSLFQQFQLFVFLFPFGVPRGVDRGGPPGAAPFVGGPNRPPSKFGRRMNQNSPVGLTLPFPSIILYIYLLSYIQYIEHIMIFIWVGFYQKST